MENVKKILFPVDLSGVSPKIAPSASAVAKKYDAELHLLHVTAALGQFTSFYTGEPVPSLESLDEDLKRTAEKKLKEFEESYCKECSNVKRIVLQGDPADAILEYIDTEGIDLVIMGTHGRKGLDRVLLGSVVDKIVKGSSAPVLSVNPYKRK